MVDPVSSVNSLLAVTAAGARLDDKAVFDPHEYLRRYQDLAAAGLRSERDARRHWVEHGIGERRQGNGSFNVQAYLDANPDVKAATNNDPRAGIEHYLVHGQYENRPLGRVSGAGFAGGDSFGVVDGGTPSRDPALPIDGPAAAASGSAASYLDPDVFVWDDYVGRYPDLRQAGIADEGGAGTHWLNHGIGERRQASPGFNVQAYLDANPDVKQALHDNPHAAIDHYIRHGRSEGRSLGAVSAAPAAPSGAPVAPAATTAPVQAASIPADGVRVGNGVMQVGVSPRTGGAINSLIYDGREYINDFDHGRQLQVAWQMNGGGEGNNPTEAGSAPDGAGPRSSSRVLGVASSTTALTVTSNPAWWLRAGDVVPANGQAATNGGASAPFTDQVLTKSIEVGAEIGGVYYPNILQHYGSVTFPEGATSVGFELPTGYLQGDFSAHYFYSIDSGALVPRPPMNSYPDASGNMQTEYSRDANASRHRPDPVILATPDGKHAMAVVAPQPMPAGFSDQVIAHLSFPHADPAQATQKWSVVMSANNVRPGATLAASTYMVTGTLQEVQATLGALYGKR